MIKIIKGKKILTLSEKNSKLIPTKENKFLIWSIPAVVTCPNRTALCERYCYAMKSQRLYPNTKNSREESFNDSLSSDFVTNIIDTIHYYLDKKSYEGKNVYFRIHESGDFYSKEYVNKWIQIVKQFPAVHFMGYTKSVQFFKDVKLPQNLVIRYSIWADSNPADIELASQLQLPIYTAFNKVDLDKAINENGFIQCVGSCENCKMCYKKDVKKLAIKIH
ncbi:MAG: hypothetical protein ABF633_03355 [Clostridium sp.]|uniref:GP88 family protein n=1 Tax=Clostridium sp. TaxID=1506 RepID=UPI0039EBAA83